MPRVPFAIVLLLAFLPAATPARAEAGAARSLEELSERVRPSVVEILGVVEASGDTSYGTGFVYEERDLVVTNAHVVRGVRDVMVRSFAGALLASVEVLHVEDEVDLAILRVTGLDLAPLGRGEETLPEVGRRVVAIGHPRGYEFTVSEGIVSAIRALDEGGVTLLQTTAPISPGSSGGPLLDAEGRVVGVCSLTLMEGQNINFAVPIRELRPVVARAREIERALADRDVDALGPDELARLVRTEREKGDLVRAGELLRRALDAHPKNLSLLVEAAEVAWSSNSFEEVAGLVARIERIDPGYGPALQIRAAWLAQEGRCEESVRAARRALEAGLREEQAAEAHAVLGECLGRLGDVEGGLEHVTRALENERIAALPDYHVLRAFLLLAVGRPDEADIEAVAALRASGWDPIVVAALRERGLPRLVEIVSQKAARAGEGYAVRGVLRNVGPVALEEIVVSAEGLDASGLAVASGSSTASPGRLVPGQTGAFHVRLEGLVEDVEQVNVRVVDFRER